MKNKIHLTTGTLLCLGLILYIIEMFMITFYSASPDTMALCWIFMVGISPFYVFTGDWKP